LVAGALRPAAAAARFSAFDVLYIEGWTLGAAVAAAGLRGLSETPIYRLSRDPLREEIEASLGELAPEQIHRVTSTLVALLHLKLREKTDDATKPRSKKQTKSMPYARVPRTQVKTRGASALSTSAPKFGSLAGAELVLPLGFVRAPR
jgi:hypothetical protein